MGKHITAGNGITGVWHSHSLPTHYWRIYGRRFRLILRLYGCGIYFGGRLYGSLEDSTKSTLQAEPGQTTMRDGDTGPRVDNAERLGRFSVGCELYRARGYHNSCFSMLTLFVATGI